MGKLGGKIRNTATYAASKTFSEDYIKKQSLSGEHNGEPMMRVAQRIMSDPHVDMEPQSKNNKVYDLVYNDENKGSIIVGWAEPDRGVGEIAQKAYDHVHAGEDGIYVTRLRQPNNQAAYAVKVWDSGAGIENKYLCEAGNDENNLYSSSAASAKKFDSYDQASSAASDLYLNLHPGQQHDCDEDFDENVPDGDDNYDY